MGRPGLENHPKFRRAMYLLAETRAHIRGHLELLWAVAYECGDPKIGDVTDVELAADWQGEPGKFCKAILMCGGKNHAGFIEELPDESGRYQVHDLYDHAPEYVRKRMDRELARHQAGKTLSEIRAEAAHKRWEKTNANVMQTADTCSQTDASVMQMDANGCKCHANGTTPAPAPAPAPARARAQKEGERAKTADALDTQIAKLLELWNAVPGIVKACRMGKERRKALATRLKEDADWWRLLPEALAKIPTQPFVLGQNDRGWTATLDWLLRPQTLNKVLEGQYASNPNVHRQGSGRHFNRESTTEDRHWHPPAKDSPGGPSLFGTVADDNQPPGDRPEPTGAV